MAVLVSAQNLVTLFLGFELLSIPLYVLCASEYRREGSLESGLKYLVIGSVGLGDAGLRAGADLRRRPARPSSRGSPPRSPAASSPTACSATRCCSPGSALVIVGFAFKASVAPFHQWTPDVYEGAPTPITAFMATATKAAALGVLLRFFDVAVIGAQDTWAPALAAHRRDHDHRRQRRRARPVLAEADARLLERRPGRLHARRASSSAPELGVEATVLYLVVYLIMNIAAFAVIVADQNARADGDDLSGLAGLGARNPWLAWPMTISMLALAGIPGTVGFIGKFQLIHALVDGDYTWLAIVLVIGSMISLGYYLRVVAAIWMRAEVPGPGPGLRRVALAPGAAGWRRSPAARPRPTRRRRLRHRAAGEQRGGGRAAPEVTAVAVLFGTASVVFGIFPSVLFNLAAHAGRALGLS